MSIELITALQNPTLYDHPTEGFSVLETHISWVILTGPYAYKIKKPVNFGFLDFSSLEKRHYFCNEELRLNRRLAPSLYLEVISISGSETCPVLSRHTKNNPVADIETTHHSKPIEYALKMVQFPQDGLLDTLQEEGLLTSKHIQTLANTLADFHQTVNIIPPNNNYGTAPAIFHPVKENFEQIQSRLSQPEQLAKLLRLQKWADSEYQRLQPLLDQRKNLGFIRECHGDLHLGNIALFNQSLVIFDCIEFNDSLSWIDVISDIAFLVMDLEKRGQFTYANQLTNHYLELTGDYQGAALLCFYKAYRAMVRAKVAVLSLQDASKEDSDNTNNKLMNDYRQYIELAERYEILPSRYILVMHGYSGSGKSIISHQLIEQLGAIRVRTDVERKRLFNYKASDNTQSPIDGGIYTQEATQKTYSHVAQICSALLEGGQSVIVDAANLKQWQRNLFLNIAESHAVPLVIISCTAEEDILKERIIKRATQCAGYQDASEAKVDTLKSQLSSSDPLSSDELQYTIPIFTNQAAPIEAVIKRVKAFLK